MSTALEENATDNCVAARFDLSLKQPSLDAVRILSVLRTRGYELERFELQMPAKCYIWVRIKPSEVGFLCARLERLAGVSVEGDATWGR